MADVKNLIESVKGLNDDELNEFLDGLGVKAEPQEVKDAGQDAAVTDEAVAKTDGEVTAKPSTEDVVANDAKTDETVKAETKDVVGDTTANQEVGAEDGDDDKKEVAKHETEPADAVKDDKAADGEVKATEEKPAEDNAGDITGTPEDNDVPVMTRGPAKEEADQVASQPVAETPAPAPAAPAPVMSDDGKPIPTDYESIIAGLNAKNAALESEMAILRQKAEKVDAAFGYTARPPEIVKVDNGLYDPNFNVKMHR